MKGSSESLTALMATIEMPFVAPREAPVEPTRRELFWYPMLLEDGGGVLAGDVEERIHCP